MCQDKNQQAHIVFVRVCCVTHQIAKTALSRTKWFKLRVWIGLFILFCFFHWCHHKSRLAPERCDYFCRTHNKYGSQGCSLAVTLCLTSFWLQPPHSLGRRRQRRNEFTHFIFEFVTLIIRQGLPVPQTDLSCFQNGLDRGKAGRHSFFFFFLFSFFTHCRHAYLAPARNNSSVYGSSTHSHIHTHTHKNKDPYIQKLSTS